MRDIGTLIQIIGIFIFAIIVYYEIQILASIERWMAGSRWEKEQNEHES